MSCHLGLFFKSFLIAYVKWLSEEKKQKQEHLSKNQNIRIHPQLKITLHTSRGLSDWLRLLTTGRRILHNNASWQRLSSPGAHCAEPSKVDDGKTTQMRNTTVPCRSGFRDLSAFFNWIWPKGTSLGRALRGSGSDSGSGSGFGKP